MRPIRRPIPVLLAVLAPLALACSDPNELLPPSDRNFVDTLSIFALSGTPVQSPSGYSVPEGPVRTDRSTACDFAYDLAITSNDTRVTEASWSRSAGLDRCAAQPGCETRLPGGVATVVSPCVQPDVGVAPPAPPARARLRRRH